MSTLTYTGQLVIVTCWCGTEHAVPAGLRKHQLSEHAAGRNFWVHCPLGHEYAPGGEPETAKLERRLAQAQTRETALRDQLGAEERSHRATKGQLTKAKKRIGNGVCPCCNRHFTNVERHMASQHPHYGEPA